MPRELYHNEWIRRKIRNYVHLTIAGCIGPCTLANAVLLIFDGREIWFHSINAERLVMAIYDYIDSMMAAGGYLPVPPSLADHHFTVYQWDAPGAAPAWPSPETIRTQSGFLFLTHAATDLLTLERARRLLPDDFPPITAVNLLDLQDDERLDQFLAETLPGVEAILIRLWGGRATFARGLDAIRAHVQARDQFLIAIPGTADLDPELTSLSNAGVPIAHYAAAYLQSGGADNMAQLFRFLSDHLLTTGFGYDDPAEQPQHGLYHPALPARPALEQWQALADPTRPTAGILFYRSHFVSGNTAFVDVLVRACESKGLNALPIYTYSLKETMSGTRLPAAFQYLVDEAGRPRVDVLITTMSFAVGNIAPDGATIRTADESAADAFATLNVPVVQAITSGMSRDKWAISRRGLYPLDVAMNVALPEFDGRLISVPVSFKESPSPVTAGDEGAPSASLRGGFAWVRSRGELYAPLDDRAARAAGLAARLAALRCKPNAEKRIAFVLTNSPGKASRIGNAVGLDAPESLRRILAAMREVGYSIAEIPETGDALIHGLIDRCSYDTTALTPWQLEQAAGQVAVKLFETWQHSLPEANQKEMRTQWNDPPVPGTLYTHQGRVALPGLALGNVFIALQPPRGYGADPNAIYHAPDLPPTYQYHALYRWLREPAELGGWGADAIVHLGKHGTLEWLPGKGIGLSQTCYPDLFLDDLPLVYPFILNNPGEGAQAKRRAHAVIIDHMTPPLTQAGMYGGLYELAQLVDEYYQVEALDPSKLPILQQQIWELIRRERLDRDLAAMLTVRHGDHSHAWDGSFTDDGTPTMLAEITGKDFTHLMEDLDGYLCELGGATIRDGLHILGWTPQGEQLIETLAALTRLPNLDVPSLPDTVARLLGYDLRLLREAPGARSNRAPGLSNAEVIEHVDTLCRALLRELAATGFDAAQGDHIISNLQSFASPGIPVGQDKPPLSNSNPQADLCSILAFICNTLVPNLRRNTDEIANLLRALNGEYVPAGPSGAPTRGMAHVLPTGRNFYTVDPRSLPSLAAWRVGEQLADELIRRYQRDEGHIPETVGMSIWGTSAMRTHGDDIAQVFALLGVRPRWQAENKRLTGVDVIPLDQLKRPRIDVVCRISGFFRDAFPHLIALMDQAVRVVSDLDEPPELNFLRKHVLERQAALARSGLAEPETLRRARYRLFGSKPGAYGAGILPLLDEGNWRGDADFAQTYLNWGGYAYTETDYGVAAQADFAFALSGVNVAAKNQDNREHDLFDSDDYLQYHGGMIAAIRALTGRAPRKYFGDNSDPARPRLRDLKEEVLRVFRSRVVNPKWLASARRHGYKGGLELAATVDYVFGYDATAEVMEDWMYTEMAERYALDPETQAFLRQSNPWALRDIVGRLQEAVQRGMWSADETMKERLGDVYLTVDGDLEDRLDRVWAQRVKE